MAPSAVRMLRTHSPYPVASSWASSSVGADHDVGGHRHVRPRRGAADGRNAAR